MPPLHIFLGRRRGCGAHARFRPWPYSIPETLISLPYFRQTVEQTKKEPSCTDSPYTNQTNQAKRIPFSRQNRPKYIHCLPVDYHYQHKHCHPAALTIMWKWAEQQTRTNIMLHWNRFLPESKSRVPCLAKFSFIYLCLTRQKQSA